MQSASNSSSRRRRRRQRAKKVGLPPGTPVYTGDVVDAPVEVTVIDYDPERVSQSRLQRVSEALAHDHTRSIAWLNMEGVHKTEEIAALGNAFGIHPLWIEDIMNPECRPKCEQIGDRLLVVLRVLRVGEEDLDMEHVAAVLGPGWVLTFQERPGDVWDGVRHRILSGGGRIRRMGADYLLHALLDSVVDHYFLALEWVEGQVDQLEERALLGEVSDLPAEVLTLRSTLVTVRQVVWPMREAALSLLRSEEMIHPDAAPFFRDLYDHLLQVMETLDATRDRLSSVVELHLAQASQRLNEVMRVLTVVSTIFIPLTFIAGVYGMNFRWMPELEYQYAYPIVMGSMLIMAIIMFGGFRRRGWL